MQIFGDRAHPVLEILEDLIRIPSVNPHYDGSSAGEIGIADYLEHRFNNSAFSVTRQPVLPRRDNVIVELKTGHPDRVLLFEAHMDTVSFGSMLEPLTPLYREGKLFGRGSCDTKSTLAGMIYAMEQCALQPELLNADLILCASVDEEHAYRGLTAFMELNIPIAAAVVGEPTELSIVVEHKGCTRFLIRTHGKAAHSSVPSEGDSAIYQMVHVLRHIKEKIEPQLIESRTQLCGAATIAVGTISGGEEINIIPEACEIKVDRRIIPGETPQQVLMDFESSLRNDVERYGVKLTIDPLLYDPALHTHHDAEVVKCAQKAARALGLKSELCGVPYGSNASKLQQYKGIPTIVYGPGSIAQAHSREEWVPVDGVIQAAEFYLRLAQTF
ncbi:M20 family metallopeptidase [Paenibacillus koleovorans]|uniref:M20 family metallopeptidase n=1 Tax=Paenibacillus koleovorans TaxID=121608 RepID=UPI0013E2B746|nr:M20/M25/M40 family metallo-hydrolase [Paenibacillus koleovorans]